MKTNRLFAVTFLLGLLATACSAENTGGRFPKTTPRVSTVDLKLSTSSPSGSRTVSVNDGFMMFEMSASAAKTLPVGKTFTVTLQTDPDDIETTKASTVTVYLKKAGSTIGQGAIVVSGTSKATATISLTSDLALSTTPTALTLVADTMGILAEDAGFNDPLDTTVQYRTKSVNGNTLLY